MRKGTKTLLISVAILTVLLLGGGTLFRVFAAEGKETPAASFANFLFRPVQSIFSKTSEKVTVFLQTFSSKEELLYKNKQLEAEIASLKREERQTISVRQENKRLRDLLELKTQFPKETMIACEVIARHEQGNETRFQINKGKNQGLSINDVVVGKDGVIGTICAVSADSAIVMPIYAFKSAAGARVVRTQAVCVAEGTGDARSIRLTFLTEDTLPSVGDEVETSGLGGVYPEGFLLGVVKDIRRDGGVFEAGITPKVDFSKVYEVMVIKSALQKEQ